MFWKYELLSLDQVNSSSDPSQILILQFLMIRASLPPSPSLSNFTLANWNPLQHNLHHVLHQYPYFVLHHSTTSYHKSLIYQTRCKGKLFKFISKLYTDHNSLWVKQAIHQKAEFLKAASTWSLPSLSSIQSILNFLQNGRYYFNFSLLLVHITTATISTKALFLYVSHFWPPYSTLTCSKNHPYNPH